MYQTCFCRETLNLFITLLVANLANTKWCKNSEKSLKPWQMVTDLRVLIKSFHMNTNLTGFGWFSRSLQSCALNESSLTIGRVKAQMPWVSVLGNKQHRYLSVRYCEATHSVISWLTHNYITKKTFLLRNNGTNSLSTTITYSSSWPAIIISPRRLLSYQVISCSPLSGFPSSWERLSVVN